MDSERKVHRDCRNASNPYHECSEYCCKKIAEAIAEEAKAKLIFEQFRSSRNMDSERSAHRDCRNASNPYHECSVYCFKIIAEAKAKLEKDGLDVKSAVSSTIRSIIDKHGDIAANCKLESASMRSRYVECLCSLMQELGSTLVGQLTEAKVKEMLAVVKDLEYVNIDVGWLRLVLEEFARYQEERNYLEKETQEGPVRTKIQELEIQEADLARIEDEVKKPKSRGKKKKKKAELAKPETEKMEFEVEKFKGKMLLVELL